MTAALASESLHAFRAAPRRRHIGHVVLVCPLEGITPRAMWLARRLAAAGYEVAVPDVFGSLGLDAVQAEAVETVLRGGDALLDARSEEAVEKLADPLWAFSAVRGLRGTADSMLGGDDTHDGIGVVGAGWGGVLGYQFAAADDRVRIALAYDAVMPDVDVVEDIKGAAATFYGDADLSVSDAMPELRAAMRRAGVPFSYKAYPDVSGASLERAESAAVRRDVWRRSLALLSLHLA